MRVIHLAYRVIIILMMLMTAVIFAQEYSLEQEGMGPAQDGPFNDEVFGAVSEDGVNFRVLDGPFFKHASVPDVLELVKDCLAGVKGTLLLYFVDFSAVTSPGSEGISLATSKDGLNWSKKNKVTIEGKVNQGAAVDPSVVQLADGRIRLFFFGSEVTEGDPARHAGDHKIYSAISEDGIHFQVEPGVCFQTPFITDPEVLSVNGEWLMFLSRGQETLLARAQDGLRFTLDEAFSLSMGGVPGAVDLPQGRVRILATGREGIVSALFAPDSHSPPITEEGERIFRGNALVVADPACVRRLDGSYYLIFKSKPDRFGRNR